LGRAFVGSIFLASATSLPEIMVDFNAIRIGQPDLAVGDLFGSSLFNLLILTIVSSVIVLPKGTSILGSQHAVTAVLSIMLTAAAGFGLLVNLEFSILRAGPFAWFGFLCYLFGLRLLFLQSRVQETAGEVAGAAGEPTQAEDKPLILEKGTHLGKAITGYLACAMMILLAAPYLTEAADQLAVLSGLGHSFVGTTFVALSTSLPELVATVTAFRMGSPDLAFGNIFGSNTFNMAIFLPLDWYYSGNLLRDASDINAISGLGIILATSICVIALLYPPVQRRYVLVANGLVILSVLSVLMLLYRLGTP
jgi:cation:H+ antiporter